MKSRVIQQSYKMLLLLLFSHPVASDSVTSWTATPQFSLPLTISQSLPKFMSIASVMPSSHLILWCPLLLSSIIPSIRYFQWVSCSHQVTKILKLQLQHQSFNECSVVSLKIDRFDLPAVQGTLRSLLQHHSSKASIPWHSVFFTIQLSQPHVTTGKTIALTIQTFVGRVMSLLFNTQSMFVAAIYAINETKFKASRILSCCWKYYFFDIFKSIHIGSTILPVTENVGIWSWHFKKYSYRVYYFTSDRKCWNLVTKVNLCLHDADKAF